MLRFAIALMVAVLTGEGAQAAFINNSTDWQALGANDRLNYVRGLFDRVAYDEFKGEEQYLTTRRRGIENCALTLKLTGQALAEALSRHYSDMPKDASVPPAIVFDYVVQNICLDAINTERAKFGLPAWALQTEGVLGGR
jgi:hypothetical protein